MTISQTLTVAKTGGEPVSEFLLIPFGWVEAERAVAGGSFVFTRDMADQAIAAFHAGGRRLSIDYEHQSLARFNRRLDGLSPAAGWVAGLQVRPDGLWAVGVEWTPRARELVAAGEYAYHSPVIYWTDDTHSAIEALGPVALTNEPAMTGVRPLLAAVQERNRMYATILAAQALPIEQAADAGATAEVIGAIEEFAARANWVLFREAMSEELINAVGVAFADDDARVLVELGSIVNSIEQGLTPREIVGSFLIENPNTMSQRTSSAHTGLMTSQRSAVIAAAKKTYAAEIGPGKSIFCSERSWVHTALRDAGYSSLTDGEIVRYGITDATVGRGGRHQSSGTRGQGRATIIGAAKMSYAQETANAGKPLICSEQAWVHTALRDAKQKPLIDEEIRQYGIGLETPGKGGRTRSHRSPAGTSAGTQDRATIIAVARKSYAAELRDPSKMTICSEHAWVHTALRDAKQKPLTEKESTQYGIAVDH